MNWDSESKFFRGTVYGGRKGNASFNFFQNASKSLALYTSVKDSVNGYDFRGPDEHSRGYNFWACGGMRNRRKYLVTLCMESRKLQWALDTHDM